MNSETRTPEKKLKVTPVGRYRYGLFTALFIALASVIVFGSDLTYAVAGAISVTWIIFEQWVIQQTTMGVQRMLAYLMQPVKGDANKAPDVIPIDINTGDPKETEKLTN